jgi:hypothetical protein
VIVDPVITDFLFFGSSGALSIGKRSH